MATLRGWLARQRSRHVAELAELVSIPSVSTDPRRAGEIARAARWVRQRLRRAGCTRTAIRPTGGHPVVHGEWLGRPGAPTVLVYGHYDVQPEDPVEAWTDPPFAPRVRGGRLYGRGASDNKGQFLAHVAALEARMAVGGSPVNVKFLIEGEEEIGSPHLASFVRQKRRELACDAVVVSDSPMLAKGVPAVCYGLRGLCYLELTVEGTRRDLHSGAYGGAVLNPANALAAMIASLHDGRGRIHIPGFHDRVRRPGRAERRRLARLPHSDRDLARSIGAPALHGETGYTTLERLWTRPSLDVNGVWGGFMGDGAKTVIPGRVSAKLSMRLVPDQRPQEVARLVAAHLERIAPPAVRVTVRELHGGEPWLAAPEHPARQAAARALGAAFDAETVFVREGGTIPVVPVLERVLRAPVVLMGLGLATDNLHAPDEHMALDNFHRGIEAAALFLDEIAAEYHARPGRAGRPRSGGGDGAC